MQYSLKNYRNNFKNQKKAQEILSKYEAQGFSIYARAAQNVRKTVKHQHTHLIILNYDRRIRWLFNVTNKILWWRNFSK